MNENLKPAVKAALRFNEIGNRSPYRLSFAGKGKSGASFGAMQGDLYGGPVYVRSTFSQCLKKAGVTLTDIDAILRRLIVPLIQNPLSVSDTARVNDALLAQSELVDRMDAELMGEVLKGLDACYSAAAAGGHSIAPDAALYMACWINQSGPPTTLLHWLKGEAVMLSRQVGPPRGPVVTGEQAKAYVMDTEYFDENPGNVQHLVDAVNAGKKLLA